MCFLPRLGALQTGSNVHPSVHDTPAATPAFLPATRTLDPLTTPTHGSIEVRLYEPPSIQPVRPPARPPSPQKKNDVPAIAPNAIYPRHISSHHCTASYTQRIGWAVPLCSEGEAGEPSGGGPEGDRSFGAGWSGSAPTSSAHRCADHVPGRHGSEWAVLHRNRPGGLPSVLAGAWQRGCFFAEREQHVTMGECSNKNGPVRPFHSIPLPRAPHAGLTSPVTPHCDAAPLCRVDAPDPLRRSGHRPTLSFRLGTRAPPRRPRSRPP